MCRLHTDICAVRQCPILSRTPYQVIAHSLIGNAPRTGRGIQCDEERDNGRQPLRTRELIDTAPVSGGGELRLFRRGDEYIIALGGNELVSSRMRAFDPGANPDARMTAAILSAMADNLDAHTFGPAGTARSFDVIDGGKQD